MERATNTGGQQFLNLLGVFPKNTFERAFSNSSEQLGLGDLFEGAELGLLFEAAFRARLCNIAFNGLGGCDGRIKPEREPHRMEIEREFMEARDEFFATVGWQALAEARRGLVLGAFLRVAVNESRLAN